MLHKQVFWHQFQCVKWVLALFLKIENKKKKPTIKNYDRESKNVTGKKKDKPWVGGLYQKSLGFHLKICKFFISSFEPGKSYEFIFKNWANKIIWRRNFTADCQKIAVNTRNVSILYIFTKYEHHISGTALKQRKTKLQVHAMRRHDFLKLRIFFVDSLPNEYENVFVWDCYFTVIYFQVL